MTTDNIAYMSSNKNDAIALFNRKTELELKYANELKNDIDNGNTSYFGLYNLLLQDNEFYEKFENFLYADNPKLYEFPKLYNIVRAHIYFIVIHQQQVEGLFNKHDLKTHANISLSLKESKLRLASDKTEHPKDGNDELDLLYWENWKREDSRVPSIHLEERKDENWLYINGVMTNQQLLDENYKHLDSYGIIWDTAEPIVSRSFDDETIPVRWAS
ncbi:31823_t:CDS:2 [Gigaspora margarita]|uniref:31823_t:CDS:1 n=1 Tax=Gigaspora margarita TaxID=4874 RepID=A0ABM8W356_GIGMA|nr:31823_t:CDS:2 [Gigaspora margarita]